MISLVDDAIEAYVTGQTTPATALHERLREATLGQTDMPQMQVGPVEGRLLTILTRLCRAQLAVEIGTFTGRPRGTVMSLIHRAKRKLRGAIEAQAGGDAVSEGGGTSR